MILKSKMPGAIASFGVDDYLTTVKVSAPERQDDGTGVAMPPSHSSLSFFRAKNYQTIKRRRQ